MTVERSEQMFSESNIAKDELDLMDHSLNLSQQYSSAKKENAEPGFINHIYYFP